MLNTVHVYVRWSAIFLVPTRGRQSMVATPLSNGHASLKLALRIKGKKVATDRSIDRSVGRSADRLLACLLAQ